MIVADHSYKEYDAELQEMLTRVLQMGATVHAQIVMAVDALDSGDQELMDRVIADDRHVNEFEQGIDEMCTRIMVTRQPAANDLRLVMAVSKIVTDLERVGDEATKIARISRTLYSTAPLNSPRMVHVHEIATLSIGMLKQVLDAFARLDAVKAAAVIREDRLLDERFRGIVRQLITYMLEDPRTISSAFDIVFIAKAVERIGDHAKNLAENIIYIVKGKDVRHLELDLLEHTAAS